jgi:hypothetical protein
MNVLLAGISEQSNNESFLIYPNPSDGIFNLTVNLNSFQFISITILNSLGQEIYCANDSPSTSFKNQIDLSSQPAGIYVVQLKLNDEIFSKKILIIR